MMHAIYDRTQADVYNYTDKGIIRFTDFNRLEDNTETVCDKLAIPFSKKTWTYGGIPRFSDYARIENALDSINAAYPLYLPIPARPWNSWQKWNQLEYFLWATNDSIERNEANKNYLGEFYAGEYGFI